jgi:hypothetical protein
VVKPSEAAEAFAARIPAEFGDGTGTILGSANCDNLLPYDPAQPPKKACGVVGLGGRSCKAQYFFKRNKKGVVKKGPMVRFCCYEEPACKKKLGKTLAGKTPIQIQARVNSPSYTDLSLLPFTVVIDPIGAQQLPAPDEQSCRRKLGLATRRAAQAVSSALLLCRQESVPGGSDCDPNSFQDPKELVNRAEREIRDAVEAECAGSGLPSDFGFTACRAPCDNTTISDWDAVADCIICHMLGAIDAAYDDAYPLPIPPDQSAEGRECQNGIGDTLDSLMEVHLAEITKCQAKFDTGKASLSEDTEFCKTADPRGQRLKVDAKAETLISKNCPEGILLDVHTCGTTVTDVSHCVIRDARVAAERIADALYTEGQGFSGSACLSDEECAAHDTCVDGECRPEPCSQDTDCRNFTDLESSVACNEDTGECCRVGADPDPACDVDFSEHTCVLDSSSEILINSQAIPVQIPLSGSLDIACGTPDPVTGKAVCSCDIQSIDPIQIPSIGWLCVNAPPPGCPAGEIDCNGGNGLDTDLMTDHNISACTSNADCESACQTYCVSKGKTFSGSGCEGFCEGGSADGSACTASSGCPGGFCVGGGSPHGNTCQCSCLDLGGNPSRPGGLLCNAGTDLVLEPELPCGDGDETAVIGQSCSPLTTETATNVIMTANNTLKQIDPNAVVGNPFDCGNLAASITTGATLVGSRNWLHSGLGDLAFSLAYTCQ